MKRVILIVLCVLLMAGTAHATTYDFEYSYGDPYLAASQQYIYSTSNVVLRNEGPYKYWKPTSVNTPGIVTYHFNFADQIADANLYLRTDTFRWTYSYGHNFLYASTDGQNWQEILEVEPPVNIGGWQSGNYNEVLPSNLVGMNDIWLKVELNSIRVSGSNSNTAQLSRFDTNPNNPNTTFRLGVNFAGDGDISPAPEPTTMLLFGLGLLGLSSISRKRK